MPAALLSWREGWWAVDGEAPPVRRQYATSCLASSGATGIETALFVPNPPPVLHAKTRDRFRPARGVVAERVSYDTQFGMRVPAILYLPEGGQRPGPALIVENGRGGDKYSWYAFWTGILHARAGAAVPTYDPVGEGERNIARKSGTRAHDRLEEPRELARRLAGLMMIDLRQAVSYLASGRRWIRGASELGATRWATASPG